MALPLLSGAADAAAQQRGFGPACPAPAVQWYIYASIRTFMAS